MITFLIKTYRPLGLAILALVCFGFTPQAHATMSSTAPIGTGKIVKGCCSAACAYTIGRIVSPQGVDDDFEWFDDTLTEQIEKMGESLEEGEQKITPVLNKRFESQNATFRALLTSYGYAREKSRNNKIFGPQSAAYTAWNRSNFLVGQGAANSLDVRLRHQASRYAEGFRNKKQIAARLSEVDASDINPRCVFPANGTLAKGAGEKLVASLNTLMEAFPTVNIPESYQNTGAGEIYRTMRKIRRLRAQIAEAVLSEVMVGYMPTMPVDDGALAMWQAAGGKGEPSGVEDGHISPVGYLGFLVQSRFANDDFRTGTNGIHSMTQVGILREMATVSTLRMAISQRQLRRSQQIAFMAAMQVSGTAAMKSLELNEALHTIMED